MKKGMLGAVLSAALVLSLGAIAQGQAAGTAPADQQQKQGQNHHGHMHGMKMDSQARLDHMSKSLNLTDDQKTKIKPILDNADQQMQALRADTSTQQQDRRAKAMDIHKNTMEQVRAILTPEQQQKFDEMQQKRMEHRHGKRDQKPGASAATPQN